MPSSSATVQRALKVPGVNHIVNIAGLDGASFSSAPNAATMFLALDDFPVRAKHHQTGDSILAELRKNLSGIDAANVLVIAPPPVRGIGTGGGFKMMVQDRANAGPRALEAATVAMMMKANAVPGLTSVFTLYNTGTPRIYADIDREKAQQLGVAPSDVFSTLETYLGSSYINDFNLFGRTWRVTAQADAPFRHQPSDIVNLKTRSASGHDGADRVGRDADATIPARTASSGTTSIRPRSCRAIPSPASRAGRRSRRWRISPPRRCRPVSAMNGPSSPISRRRRAIPRRSSSRSRWCSSSCCWRRSTNRWCCRSRSS